MKDLGKVSRLIGVVLVGAVGAGVGAEIADFDPGSVETSHEAFVGTVDGVVVIERGGEPLDSATPLLTPATEGKAMVMRHYMISQAAFSSRSGGGVTHSTSNGGAWPSTPTTSGLAAPINLPHGATIRAVHYYVIDNDANTDLSMNLATHVPTMSGFSFLPAARWTSSASPNVQVLSATDLEHVVDNATTSYQVLASPTSSWSSNSMLVRAVRIDYEVPAPSLLFQDRFED